MCQIINYDDDTNLETAKSTIRNQIKALNKLLEHVSSLAATPYLRACHIIQESLKNNGRIILTGVGKSGLIARKISSTLASTGTPAYFMHAAEASHGDLGMIQSTDVVVALSWSGESYELREVIRYTKRFGIKLIAVTGNSSSTLSKSSDITLSLPDANEACPYGIAPTSSTTMQIVFGDALAMSLLVSRGGSLQELRDLHPGGQIGVMLLRVRDVMHCGEDIPIVVEHATLTDAIIEMNQKGFGFTSVCNASGEIVGIFTDGDLRRALNRKQFDSAVSDLMTRNPICVSSDTLVNQALLTMNKMAITCLLVIEDKKPTGVVNIHDLLKVGAYESIAG